MEKYLETYLDRGAFYALGAALSIAFLGIANRFALLEMNIDVLPLVIVQMVAGGFCLAIIGYRKEHQLELETLKHPLTWAIATCRLINIWCLFQAFTYMSVTESEFLLKWTVIVALVFNFVLRREYPKGKVAWVGVSTLIGGLMIFSLDTPWIGLTYMLAKAVFIALEGSLSEYHPGLKNSFTFRQYALFTGCVMVVTGAVVGLSWIASLLVSGSADIAHASQLFQPKVLLIGILVGAVFRGAFMIMRFRAIKLLSNAYYTMVTSLIPFIALGLESALSFMGVISTPTLNGYDLFAGSIITTGALLILIARMLREQKIPSPDPEDK